MCLRLSFLLCFFFFFNDTATTEIYTLSLHDALPILFPPMTLWAGPGIRAYVAAAFTLGHRHAHEDLDRRRRDRKSTRLNSSHSQISYAVFCLKKKIINQLHVDQCSNH